MKNYLIVIVGVLLVMSCNTSTQKKSESIEVEPFNIEKVKSVIKENGKNWSIGLKDEADIPKIKGMPMFVGNTTSHDNEFQESIVELDAIWEDVKIIYRHNIR